MRMACSIHAGEVRPLPGGDTWINHPFDAHVCLAGMEEALVLQLLLMYSIYRCECQIVRMKLASPFNCFVSLWGHPKFFFCCVGKS